MKPLARHLFLWLILAQAAHSVEEYLFRLYDVLAPARWISSLFSSDLAFGFALVNTALVLLGVWCYLARVRGSRPSARVWAWGWALLEGANGAGHVALAASIGGYFPRTRNCPCAPGPCPLVSRDPGVSSRSGAGVTSRVLQRTRPALHAGASPLNSVLCRRWRYL